MVNSARFSALFAPAILGCSANLSRLFLGGFACGGQFTHALHGDGVSITRSVAPRAKEEVVKKTLFTCVVSLCFATFLAVGTARAQSQTSPQGTAAIYTQGAVCVGASSGSTSTLGSSTTPPPCTNSSGNGNWFTVMNASAKTSNTTDLFVSPSLVTGLYTDTQVNGNKHNVTTQIATAMGAVTVRVLLDCSGCADIGQPQTSTPAWAAAGYPDSSGNGVTFDQRIQTLSAQLGEAITTNCLTFTGTALSNTCSQEQLDLILDTTSAHTFNFIFLNVGSGVHTLTVQARLDASANTSCTSATDCVTTNTILPSSVAAALFSLGSMTALPVHLAPGFSF